MGSAAKSPEHYFSWCVCNTITSWDPPGLVAQLVSLTADPGVVSLIPPAQSHTFVVIDHEIISTVILLLHANSRKVVVSYKRKYVQEVLFNHLVKLAQEKMWFSELAVPI